MKFAPGTVYNYDLNSLVTVRLAGNDAQETTVQIQGQAQLFAESNCQYTLRLQKLTVFGPDHKKNELNGELQSGKPVRFTLDNDAVNAQICAESGDSEFALNLKRAVISLIQSDHTKSVETDVFGVCPTSFLSSKTGNTVIVSKSRNLNECGHRESLTNGLITGVFDESSGVKATPLLNGDYSKEQRITDGILESVLLNEEYSFVPFSNANSGAKATVVTKLNLKGKSTAAPPKQSASESRTLLFENPGAQPLANEEKLREVLKKTAETYNNNVGPKAAGQFTELIRLMRFSKKPDLLQLYQQIKSGTVHSNKNLSRKIYLDALFRTGSSESVEVIADLLKKELEPKEKRLAFLSFNLVKSLNKPALASISVSTFDCCTGFF